ncbi:MAG: hypothetical protein ACOYJQ_00395 [Pseudochelatococcus sp.]|jgi:hypothetical protein|uniref:hypothetical protein n=1 Tax=Pseudochelatococcus sp. TaxID=2020869 RepID=UPI003D92D149
MNGSEIIRSYFAMAQSLVDLVIARNTAPGGATTAEVPATREGASDGARSPAASRNVGIAVSSGISAASHVSDAGPVLPDTEAHHAQAPLSRTLAGLRPPVVLAGTVPLSQMISAYFSEMSPRDVPAAAAPGSAAPASPEQASSAPAASRASAPSRPANPDGRVAPSISAGLATARAAGGGAPATRVSSATGADRVLTEAGARVIAGFQAASERQAVSDRQALSDTDAPTPAAPSPATPVPVGDRAGEPKSAGAATGGEARPSSPENPAPMRPDTGGASSAVHVFEAGIDAGPRTAARPDTPAPVAPFPAADDGGAGSAKDAAVATGGEARPQRREGASLSPAPAQNRPETGAQPAGSPVFAARPDSAPVSADAEPRVVADPRTASDTDAPSPAAPFPAREAGNASDASAAAGSEARPQRQEGPTLSPAQGEGGSDAGAGADDAPSFPLSASLQASVPRGARPRQPEASRAEATPRADAPPVSADESARPSPDATGETAPELRASTYVPGLAAGGKAASGSLDLRAVASVLNATTPGGGAEVTPGTVASAVALPSQAMGVAILNAAMIPGWPAPRPFEMPRGILTAEREAKGRGSPAISAAQAAGSGTARDEAAIQAYLANMGLRRSLLDRIRAALRPMRRKLAIMFGLAVLVTQVVFTLHVVLRELDGIETDEDDIDADAGDRMRRTRG